MSIITVERKVLEKNDELAAQNRAWFGSRSLFVVNVISSPGSGKTSILERTLERFGNRLPVAVVEGDVQTDLDARRIERLNVPVAQIVTNGGCHLDARLVRDAVERMDLSSTRLLIIENVGNLVCPAAYDLGESLTVAVLSTTEGDDKPLKYPALFLRASVLVINKIDLLPHVPCNLSALKGNALRMNPSLTVFETSCTTGAGIDRWCDWLATKAQSVPPVTA